MNTPPLDILETRLAEGSPGTSLEEPSLSREPPRLDPDEPRSTLIELLALTGKQEIDLQGQTRLGWKIEGQLGGADARAQPVLAAALRRTDQQEVFGDLLLIDLSLYLEVAELAVEARISRWLESPGRRLIVDLDLLTALHGQHDALGATRLGWDALCAASGARLSCDAAPWRRLHAAIPGRLDLALLADDPIEDALYLIDRGEVALLRGAALAWLLDRVVTSPIVSIHEVARDLREELPTRLALALDEQGPYGREAAVMAEVELLCLHHASLIARARQPAAPVSEIWHVARWIQNIVMQSPFYGGDPQTVAARLRARLPEDPSLDEELSPTHPYQLVIGDISLVEFSLMSGLKRHLERPRNLRETLPAPLLRWLHRLATRPMSPTEKRVPSISPTLDARKILTSARQPWLRASAEAQQETIDALGALSEENFWPAQAIVGDGLEPKFAADVRERWEQGAISSQPVWARPAIALGVGAVGSHGDRLLDEILALDPSWKVKLLRLFCEQLRALFRARSMSGSSSSSRMGSMSGSSSSSRMGSMSGSSSSSRMGSMSGSSSSSRMGSESGSAISDEESTRLKRALDALLAVAASDEVQDPVRLEAAARLIELTRDNLLPGSQELLITLAHIAGRPPFRRQPSIIGALQRLGLTIGEAP